MPTAKNPLLNCLHVCYCLINQLVRVRSDALLSRCSHIIHLVHTHFLINQIVFIITINVFVFQPS